MNDRCPFCDERFSAVDPVHVCTSGPLAAILEEALPVAARDKAWQARAEAAEARVKVLEDALRPFSGLVCGSFSHLEDSTKMAVIVEPHIVWLEDAITVGDLRRARAAMEGK